MFLEMILAAAATVAPTLIFQNENVAIRLLNSSCTIEEVNTVMKALDRRTDPRNASITIQGREIKAYWVLGIEDKVLIVDEDGDGGFVLLKDFKPVPTI